SASRQDPPRSTRSARRRFDGATLGSARRVDLRALSRWVLLAEDRTPWSCHWSAKTEPPLCTASRAPAGPGKVGRSKGGARMITQDYVRMMAAYNAEMNRR